MVSQTSFYWYCFSRYVKMLFLLLLLLLEGFADTTSRSLKVFENCVSKTLGVD